MSAASYVEVCAVLGRTAEQRTAIDGLLSDADIDIVPFDRLQARAAVLAYQRYGRGSGHPAKLNLGDVFAYALASTRNEPLLFVGDDFTHTDVSPALTEA